MLLLPTNLVAVNEELLVDVDRDLKSIFRLIVFSERHKSTDLLTRYLEAVQHLQDVLSIKNAQQEAQSMDEAQEYLAHLKGCMKIIIAEIADQRTLERPVDLFRLFRAVAPDAADRHPNKFRQTLVQFGPFMAPEPTEIAGLVEQLFSALAEIRHPLVRAAYLHHELIRIHPFVDGNGRVSRMAKNWLLMYDLYPPIFIYGVNEHKQYIENLQSSFHDLSVKPGEYSENTRRFMNAELKRMKASTGFILNRMRNNPDVNFGDEDMVSAPFGY